MDKDKLYNLIDADDSLTDQEKREEYEAALADEYWEQQEDYDAFEDEYCANEEEEEEEW